MATTTATRSHAKALAWRKDYYFDPVAARRVINFFAKHIKHTKGRFAGTPFILEPWQRKVIKRLFGWKRKNNGTRKYRAVFIFVPRKNGKSTFGSGIALYLLHGDDEIGAEIVSAAGDADQANVIFSIAKDMNDSDPILRSRGKSFRKSLIVHETGSNYTVLSADAHTKHGKNLHGILFDELHVQKDRELYDVLKTSTGARSQPLEVYMTTAGFDRNSICYELYDYAKLVATEVIDDPSFMSVVYEADIKDDWTSEETWIKANPNYGISISKDYFEQQVREAKSKPAYENTFKRLHLNMWTESDVRAVNMLKWRQCAEIPINMESLAGRPCWMGLDLSSVNDLAALALIFRENDMWVSLMRFFCPEETLKEKLAASRGRVPYDLWVRQGHLIATPGGRIDYGRIRGEINTLYNVYDIREIAVDPWNAHQLSAELEKEDGFTVVHVRQGIYSLNAPTKEFISSVSETKFAHGDNPVLTWNAGNLSTEEDAAGNLKPSKKRSPEKIDGCVAIITGLSRALVAINDSSVYSERGLNVW